MLFVVCKSSLLKKEDLIGKTKLHHSSIVRQRTSSVMSQFMSLQQHLKVWLADYGFWEIHKYKIIISYVKVDVDSRILKNGKFWKPLLLFTKNREE